MGLGSEMKRPFGLNDLVSRTGGTHWQNILGTGWVGFPRAEYLLHGPDMRHAEREPLAGFPDLLGLPLDHNDLATLRPGVFDDLLSLKWLFQEYSRLGILQVGLSRPV